LETAAISISGRGSNLVRPPRPEALRAPSYGRNSFV
jgi:hypothetical protein